MKMYKILLLLCSVLYTTNAAAITKEQLASNNAICWGYYAKANMLRVQNSKAIARMYYTNIKILGYNEYQSFIITSFKKGEMLFGNTRDKQTLSKIENICTSSNFVVVYIYQI